MLVLIVQEMSHEILLYFIYLLLVQVTTGDVDDISWLGLHDSVIHGIGANCAAKCFGVWCVVLSLERLSSHAFVVETHSLSYYNYDDDQHKNLALLLTNNQGQEIHP